MSKKILNLKTILKRSSCINAVSESKDSERLYSIIENIIENGNTESVAMQRQLRSYIEAMCNKENASTHYVETLKMIGEFNQVNTNISEYIVKEFCTNIIPYCTELDQLKEDVSEYDYLNLTYDQYKAIDEAVNLNIVADRMIRNHNSLSERFDLDREAGRYPKMGLKYLVDSCADKIDTYNLKSYQKMNLTLEEVSYILDKNGYKYSRNDLTKYCLEYYLSANPYTSELEIHNYSKIINESVLLTEEDIVDNINNIKAGMEYRTNPNYDSIKSFVNGFLMSGDKSVASLSSGINSVLDHTSKQDIISNIDSIIYLIFDLCKNKTFEAEEEEGLFDCMNVICRYISNSTCMEDPTTTNDFTKEDISLIVDKLRNIYDEIKAVGNSNINYSHQVSLFLDKGLNPCLSGLEYVKDFLYSNSNIETMKNVNQYSDSDITLERFKATKFHNLVREAFNMDKIIGIKERRLINKDINRCKLNYVAFENANDMENDINGYIGEDCKADICVRQYYYEDHDAASISNFVESVCNEYNDTLTSQNKDTIRAYYMINPGLAEIRLKESTAVKLEESEYDLVMRTYDPSFQTYIKLLENCVKDLSVYESLTLESSIIDEVLNFSNYEDFTMDHFRFCVESMQYLGVPEDTIKIFGDRFADYKFNKSIKNGSINESYRILARDEREISSIVEQYDLKDNVPSDISLEALDILLAVLEAAGKPAVGGKAIEQRLKEKGYYTDDQEKADIKAKKKVTDDEDEDDEDEEDDEEVEDLRRPKNKPAPTAKKDEYPDKQNSKMEYTKKDMTKGEKMQKGLANLKLSMFGLKSKFKEMSTKEKEASRNMNNAVNSLATSIKNSLVSDRREAIIKGSVIPSFSRCVKFGLLLAGLGIITQNPIVPAIVAIGGFAVSKNLTRKERLLLLDEIETELDVLDKELALAEQNNQLNKYRALLRYKKDLQRQYQRIRYNIRVGKDIMPGSTVGMPSRD